MLAALSTEWRRIELLCVIQHRSRAGLDIDAQEINALVELQDEVMMAREAGVWDFIGIDTPSQMALDILAILLAPQVSYAVALAYQGFGEEAKENELTLSLVQALLSLAPEDTPELMRTLRAGGPLVGTGRVVSTRRGALTKLKIGRALWEMLYGVDNIQPPPGAVLVERRPGWGELVVPADVEKGLRQYLAMIENRTIVEMGWGAPRRGGPIALFSGPSGTGKTLAAMVMATEARAPIFRVDLGQLVSKYIGETEKNLNALFDSVGGTDTMLLFDECDAIVGKRGEVKDARDRYANMEVSHLLSRIESHFGPCILTTNLRSSIDPAFLRRFHVIVDFPFPELTDRLRLWRHHLPPRAPLAGDVDLPLIAQTVRMTGAAIENAAIHAAYAAAAERLPICMRHLVGGVWNELIKEGAGCSLSQLGVLASWMEEGNDADDRSVDTQAAA